jgi:hypothetical protein
MLTWRLVCTLKQKLHIVAEDNIFMLRQVVYISLCLKRLNKKPGIGTIFLCFVTTGATTFRLILSLVKEALPNVGINNITWGCDLAIRGEQVMIWKKAVV